ncbi:acetyl-CoA carboxylase carboxyltransferase subunit alpha/beta [Streptosporangium sp. NBC_01755]|uniref:carboxyl transferase domain-containing protein n=1 Tax=unclassified Streptosporangium TaxID=2632669 RepID=UPI002DD94805|nr:MULTISPECIES: carboxyl transferase domain-containing protein [unclassified Streptosporangium]WSA27914.1 acetyl-CoA carboxylase carboxyltransferase subunit alpha/beta [Streptosporangium sp. NBC_01810]WSD00614.1 acetyl-CoA carboxylase carboxyltransferase subunit alpha/beta [Streptosporangium sp. NBC_01755]
MTPRPTSHELIDQVLDPGSWISWDIPVSDRRDNDAEYRETLARVRESTGLDEAVTVGEGTIRGRRVAALIGDFRFLAGSIGVTTAERLVRAIDRATREGLPLLAAPVSGGTRMQEGTVAFVQMIKITDAIAAHRAARLPYLVYLRHPTTGGVFASWGSLGHLTVAEPGALVGFLGPRVHEAINGERFPEGVQTAENLFAHGHLDAVLPVTDLAETVDRALNVLCAPTGHLNRPYRSADEEIADTPAWDSVTRSRRPDRPGVRALLESAGQDVVRLGGARGDGILLALARFGDAPCVVLGHDRSIGRQGGPVGPDGLRMAQRGMRLARELGLPLVTIIDTSGAELSKEAEEGGLAGEIARSLHALITLESPTLCVLLGQGTGGGALALLPADRVVAAQHAWLSPLPPEGASAILHRTVDRAPELASAQEIRSTDMFRHGIVDRIVGEDSGDPQEFLSRLGQVIEDELAGLLKVPTASRLADRRARFRRLGNEVLSA